MNLNSFPMLNASLNATSAVLIVTGLVMIRKKNWVAHAICMSLAFLVSILFLASYLYYHFHHGSTHFSHQGWIRSVYFFILISHTILATFVPFLVGLTFYQAIRSEFGKHVRIAKVAYPAWLYVSITGVVIYWMLYRM